MMVTDTTDRTALIPTSPAPSANDDERRVRWEEAQATHDWLQGQLSPQTRRAYESDLRAFGQWAAARGVTSLRGVTRRLVLDWRDEMRASDFAPATIARRLSCLRKLMETGASDGWLESNPVKFVRAFRVPNVSPRHALDNGVVRALLAQPNRATVLGARDYAMLCLLLYLGLRRSEVATLTMGSIGAERSHITLRVQGKGDKTRLLPIPPQVHEAVRAYLELSGRAGNRAGGNAPSDDEPLFLRTRDNGLTVVVPSSSSPSATCTVITVVVDGADGAENVAEDASVSGERTPTRFLDDDTIWRRVRHYARLAGIGALDVHTLRHTAITAALDGGASLRRAQAMAGHADPKTTARYDSRRGDLDESAVYHVRYA